MNKWLLIGGAALLGWYLYKQQDDATAETLPAGALPNTIAPGEPAHLTVPEVRNYLGNWLGKSSDPLVAQVSPAMFQTWPEEDLGVLYNFVVREKAGVEIPTDLHERFTEVMNRFYNTITANYS